MFSSTPLWSKRGITSSTYAYDDRFPNGNAISLQFLERLENCVKITAVESMKLRDVIEDVNGNPRLGDSIEMMKKELRKMKVVEKSGTKVIRMLQRNDPFKEKKCTKPERCMVCAGDNPGGCRDNGVSYKINCEEDCPYEYTGQTNQNGYTRGG